MTRLLLALPLTSILISPALRAGELPPEIKPKADEFDRNMATFDANEVALLTVEKNTYKAALDVARRREESGKRSAGVAAIDAELAALRAKTPLPADPPAGLPETVHVYRARFLTAPERIGTRLESSRKFARDSYLKWLGGMVEVARRGRSKELEEAANSEIERVRASAPTEKS